MTALGSSNFHFDLAVVGYVVAGKITCLFILTASMFKFLFSIGLVVFKAINQFILHPWVVSPLRTLPGPKGSLWSLKYILFGEFPEILRTEAGILQREWAKRYGKVMRAVGPFGIERVMFLSPAAMQKVLVDDWIDYPRV